jgi:hypothetical protein
VGNKSRDDLLPPTRSKHPDPTAWEERYRQKGGAWGKWRLKHEPPNIPQMQHDLKLNGHEYEFRPLFPGPITHIKRNKDT